MSSALRVGSSGQWEDGPNRNSDSDPCSKEAQLGAPYPRDSAGSPHPSAGGPTGSDGRRAADRTASSRYPGPTGPFPSAGSARTGVDPASDGRLGAQYDLAPDRLGRHPAARIERGRLSVDFPGGGLGAGSLPAIAELPRRVVSARLGGAPALDAAALAGAAASSASGGSLGPGPLLGGAGGG